jgi:ribose 5-phosphate isomerase B
MTANKHEKIRAAITWTKELAILARQHNNANIICIPARYVNNRTASSMLKTFLESDFEGGRHKRRVGKIACS